MCIRLDLFDLATLDDGGKGICELVHHHLRHVCSACAWDISVSNAVFGNEDIISQTSAISSSGGHADVGLRREKVSTAQ